MAKRKTRLKKNTESPQNGATAATAAPIKFTYPDFKKYYWAVSLVFIAIPFLLYYVTGGFGYVLDDQIVITGNSFTQRGFGGIWEILSTESFSGYFGEQKDLVQGARYRPLSIVTFAIENGLWGQNAGISHIINVLLYGIVGVVMYRFLHMLYGNLHHPWWWSIPFLATLLYILHPIHTEAVANIKGRDEIMTFLLALWASIMVLKWDQKAKWSYGCWSGLIFFLALLSKENAITFLAVIPVVMYFFRNKSVTAALRYTIPFFIATIVYIAIRYSVVGYLLNSESEINDLMNNPFLEMNTGQKYATIFFTLWKYLQLSFFPYALSHDYYPYAIPKMEWSDYRAWGSLLFYIGLTCLALGLVWKKKRPGFAIAFYLITLSIVSNIVVTVGTFMNERFIFMASMGVVILLVMGIKWLGERYTILKYPAYIIMVIYLVAFAWKTWERVPDWANALTLNESAVKVNPGSARANTFMSTALYNEWQSKPQSNEKNEAMQAAFNYADNAASMIPNYKNAQLMKAGTAAELHKIDGDMDVLLTRMGEVAAYRPDVDFIIQYMDYVQGSISTDVLAEWYYNIGFTRLFQQRRNGNFALLYLKKGYDLAPRNKKIVQGLAEVYQALGNRAESEKYFEILSRL